MDYSVLCRHIISPARTPHRCQEPPALSPLELLIGLLRHSSCLFMLVKLEVRSSSDEVHAAGCMKYLSGLTAFFLCLLSQKFSHLVRQSLFAFLLSAFCLLAFCSCDLPEREKAESRLEKVTDRARKTLAWKTEMRQQRGMFANLPCFILPLDMAALETLSTTLRRPLSSKCYSDVGGALQASYSIAASRTALQFQHTVRLMQCIRLYLFKPESRSCKTR